MALGRPWSQATEIVQALFGSWELVLTNCTFWSRFVSLHELDLGVFHFYHHCDEQLDHVGSCLIYGTFRIGEIADTSSLTPYIKIILLKDTLST